MVTEVAATIPKVDQRPSDFDVIGAILPLLDHQRALQQILRLSIVPEAAVNFAETAQSLRVEDWDMLDLKMGTRRLILAKLGALGGSYLGSLTDPSQGCARP